MQITKFECNGCGDVHGFRNDMHEFKIKLLRPYEPPKHDETIHICFDCLEDREYQIDMRLSGMVFDIDTEKCERVIIDEPKFNTDTERLYVEPEIAIPEYMLEGTSDWMWNLFWNVEEKTPK